MKKLLESHLTSFSNPRLLSFFYLFTAMFLILLLGLGWQQLVKNKSYLQQEERQSLRRIIQPAPRGEILDREGRLIVGNRPVFSVVLYLAELRKDFRKEYFRLVRDYRKNKLKFDKNLLNDQARINVINPHIQKLSKILNHPIQLDIQAVNRHFSQKLLLPMTLIKDIPIDDYAKITEQIPVESPIQIVVESARYYPHGSLAAHLLGYVTYSQSNQSPSDSDNKKLTTFSYKHSSGKRGLEEAFNHTLEGSPGWEIWLVDPAGYQFKKVSSEKPIKGLNITTSIDIDLQTAAEVALSPHKGAVVVINVSTGEILAMASSPTYDPNLLSPNIPANVFKDINERGAWLNRATQGFYPPASPFKVIAAIAGLRNGAIDPDLPIYCASSYTIGKRTFREHERLSFGYITLTQALKVSSNVYFYSLGPDIGPEAIASEARTFGLDKPAGLGPTFEGKRMLIPDPQWKLKKIGESWRTGDTANMAIGQGFLLVSPLQMACFTASLARKETRTTPTLLKLNSPPSPHPENHPITLPSNLLKYIYDGMLLCGSEGTGKHSKIPEMSVSAKTGTGQIFFHGKEFSAPWYIGFAPTENPQIAVVVTIEGHNDKLWGGTTAAPIAKKIFRTYYDKYLSPH